MQNGPIFPIGDVDPRLAVQEDVLGVVTATGTPLAFHVPSLIREALARGRDGAGLDDVEVVLRRAAAFAWSCDTQGNDA